MLASRVGTRLSLEVTPAMDEWSWLVRHAGWLLEKYHVKPTRRQHLKIAQENRIKVR